MKKLIIPIIFCLTFCVYGQNNVQNDQFLQAIQKELDRNFANLKEQNPPVYLLSYRIEETENYSISASSGVINRSQKSQTRELTVQVRLGSQSMDNTREIRGDRGDMDFSIGFQFSIQLSLDDDSKSIAQTLWRETERAHKEAVKNFTKVKTSTSLAVEAEDKSEDYSDIITEQYYESPLSFADFDFNIPQWEQKLRNYTQLFAKEKEILYGSAWFSFTVKRKYFVSSEGSSIVQNATSAKLTIDAETQAEDGMQLPLYKSFFAFTPDALPDDEAIMTEVNRIKTTLLAMKNAPVVDAFSGPAILSKEAAGVFFHEIFGHRVESYRMKNETDAQTFKKKVNEQVLHPDITVIFDPTIKEYKANFLNGSYLYDDEGVKGKKVVTIEKGIMKDFLTTRKPIAGFEKSNGHARAASGYQPVSRQSNLIVETSKPYTEEQLRKMLIEEAKKQGKEYGYFFGAVQGGFTMTGRYIPNAFNVTPLEVYRIYTDGRPDELVRGVDLVGTPLAMFSQIEGVGDVPGNFAGTCGAESGGVPAGCCSPAMFIKMIETQRKAKNQNLAAVLEKPYTEQTIQSTDFQTIVFKAMEDEMQRNTEQLHIEGLEKLYYISYLVSDAQTANIESSLGGIIEAKTEPNRSIRTEVLVGSHQRNNLNFQAGGGGFNFLFGGSSGSVFPKENDYNAFRRNLWNATDDAYKDATNTFNAKITAIEQQNLSQKDLNLPDFSSIPVQTVMIDTKKEEIDMEMLKNLCKKLSMIFVDYPNFKQSRVTFNLYQADVYYLNTEGVKYKQPFNQIVLKAFAATTATNGEPLQDEYTVFADKLESFPFTELEYGIKRMATLLNQLRTAPVVEDIYESAVLFEDEAVAEIFSQAFFSSTDGLVAKRKPIEEKSSSFALFASLMGGGSTENKYDALIGKPMIDKNLSIVAMNGLDYFKGVSLTGSYKLDAEGVSADEITPLVEGGVLKTLLSDRVPTHGVSQSNGHKRLVLMQEGLQSKLMPGVVVVDAKKTVSAEKMKKQMLTIAKKKGYDYYYVVKKIGSPSPIADDIESMQASIMKMMSGKVSAIKPTVVYRVLVKDGTETLVRTATISNITIDSFKETIAVSGNKQAWNISIASKSGISGLLFQAGGMGVTASFVVPNGIILSGVEVKKNDDISLQKKPVTPNPLEK
ncbi:MAG: hypothetical protein LBI45_01345 [Bacteroidales bacterium]|jgi:predicted Zn-dependent protease|nr:hypothetical protein [Bacteroidales bacterium]